MGLRKFRNRVTGEVIEIEWNKPTPPTPEEMEGLKILAKQRQPVEPIKPGPLPDPATLERPRNADWRRAAQSAFTDPITKSLEIDTSGMVDPSADLSETGPGFVPKVMLQGFAKGVADTVSPAHIASLGSLGTGLPAVVANILLGVSGAEKALDSEKSGMDRALGGLEAAGGAAGAMVGLPKSLQWLRRMLGGNKAPGLQVETTSYGMAGMDKGGTGSHIQRPGPTPSAPTPITPPAKGTPILGDTSGIRPASVQTEDPLSAAQRLQEAAQQDDIIAGLLGQRAAPTPPQPRGVPIMGTPSAKATAKAAKDAEKAAKDAEKINKAGTREVMRDEQNLADVEAWLAESRRNRQAQDAIDAAKAGKEKSEVVRVTTKSKTNLGNESLTETFAEAAEEGGGGGGGGTGGGKRQGTKIPDETVGAALAEAARKHLKDPTIQFLRMEEGEPIFGVTDATKLQAAEVAGLRAEVMGVPSKPPAAPPAATAPAPTPKPAPPPEVAPASPQAPPAAIPASSVAGDAPDWVKEAQAELEALSGGAPPPPRATATEPPAPPPLPEAMQGTALPPPSSGMMTNATLERKDVDETLRRLLARLSPEQRQSAYRALGGMSKAFREGYDPSTGGFSGDISEASGTIDDLIKGGGGETGAIDPQLLYMLGRTGLGAAAGSAYDEDDPLRGGFIGGLGGMIAGPGLLTGKGPGMDALRLLNRLRYEAMLFGPAQVTNLIGNAGGLMTTPVIELARGNMEPARRAVGLYTHPTRAFSMIGKGFREGWNTAGVTKHGIEPIGPSGKMLRGVDSATKRVMTEGLGLTPREAEVYTYSGTPVTKFGGGLAQAQSHPLGQLIAPFVRTGLNLAEVGTSLSPLRYFDRTGKGVRSLIPAESPINEALLSTLGPAMLYMGYKGLGPSNPTAYAVDGPVAAPYGIGRSIRDYGMYDREPGLMPAGRDLGRAITSQIPFISDIPRISEQPENFAQNLAAQFLPPALMMLGDKTVRDTNSISDAIRERIPGMREDLPARRNFLGDPLERNMLGQYPDPQYETDPLARRLADLGALRREQSPNLGGLSPANQMVSAAFQDFLQTVPEGQRSPLQEIMEAASPIGNNTLDPHEQSRLQELRGQSTRKVLEQVVNSPEFNQLPIPTRAAIVRMLMSRAAMPLGTAQFRAERLGKAAGGQ